MAFTCSNCTGSLFSLNNTAGFAYALAEVDLDATGRIGKQVQLRRHLTFRLTVHARQHLIIVNAILMGFVALLAAM